MFLFKMRVKSQLALSFTIVLSILLLVGLVGLAALDRVEKELVAAFKQRIPAINYLLQADRDLQQMSVAERTLLYEGLSDEDRKTLLKTYEENYQQTITRVNKYAALQLTPVEQDLVDKFHSKRETWHQQSDQIVRSIGSEDLKVLQQQVLGTSQNFEDMRNHLDQAEEIVLDLAKQEYYLAETVYVQTFWFLSVTMIVGGVIGLGLAIAIGGSINRRLNRVSKSLQRSSQENESNSDQLKNFAESVSASVTQQASAIQETVSILNEITSMVNSSVQSAEDASKKAVVSSEISEDGKAAVSSIRDSINHVKQSIEELGAQAEKNFDRMLGIVGIMKKIQDKATIINDIVFQTKLLSFNASVEAARAGDQGRGFSVVAEEVGILAQSSGVAAKEITAILNSSIDEVDKIIHESRKDIQDNIERNKTLVASGVETADRGQGILGEIVEHSLNVRDLMSNISRASKEQAEGVQNITIAMNEIDNASEENANIAHKTSNVASKLNCEAKKLKLASNDLDQMVAGVRLDTIETVERREISTTGKVVPLDLARDNDLEPRPSLSSSRGKMVVGSDVPSYDDEGFN